MHGATPFGPVTSNAMLRSLAEGALFGERWGPPPPRVLALHGWRRTHADFSAVLGPDSPQGAIGSIAPDLPGFGATPAPPVAWGSADYADTLARLVGGPDWSGGPAVVLGHSLGARVATVLAWRHPDLVAGLVLTGAPLLPKPGGGRRSHPVYRYGRRLNRLRLVSDDRLERLRQRYGSEDYRLAHGVMRDTLVSLVSESYEEAIAALSCPVELVWGDDDDAAPLSVAEALHERIAGSNLVVCPGAGHLTPLSVPDELRRAVERCSVRIARAS